jgi:hypothetical protein
VGLLVGLSIPALWLRTSKPADNALAPQNIPALKAFADVRRDFRRRAGPGGRDRSAEPGGRARCAGQGLGPTPSHADQRAPDPNRHEPRWQRGRVLPPLRGTGDNTQSRRAISAQEELVRRRSGASPAPRPPSPAPSRRTSTTQVDRGLPYVIGPSSSSRSSCCSSPSAHSSCR